MTEGATGRYAVVGGGVAGLAAAWQLVAAGAAVTVYEARDRAGGRVRTDRWESSAGDVGVQLLGSSFDRFFEMVRGAGAGGMLVRAPGRDALWRNGRPQALTYGSVASMLASGALPTGLKLRLGARYLPYLARHARGLDMSDPARTGGAALDGESVAAWGGREMGEDFVERLAYPLLAGYYGAAPEDTSVGLLHALAQAGMDVHVYAAEGGMGALVAAIAAALEARGVVFRMGEAVTEVAAGGHGGVGLGEAVSGTGGEGGGNKGGTGGAAGAASADGVRVCCGRGAEGEGEGPAGRYDAVVAEHYDGVVVATPAPQAAALLGEATTPRLREFLTGVRMRPTVTLALYLDAPVRGDWFGLSFPRTDPIGRHVAAVCLQSRKLPGLVAPGREVAVVLPSPGAADALADATPGQVVEALLPWVVRALPGLDARILHARAHRFEDGYTLYPPGHLRAIAGFDAAWLPDRVALAGDYLFAPTVEGAVRSGVAAVRRLLQTGPASHAAERPKQL